MLTTRRATLNDVDAIVFELNKHIASCKNYYPPADREAVAMTVHSSYHHTSPILTLLCVRDDGQIIGISSVVASQYLWSRNVQAEIRLVYVVPEHRNSRAFHYMMREIYKWCVEKKCAQISFSLATGVDDDLTARLLQKRGWDQDGIGMVKRL